MANKKVSSAPLFGSPTVQQVKSVQDAIEAYAANLVKNGAQARKLLTEIEPAEEPGDPAVDEK